MDADFLADLEDLSDAEEEPNEAGEAAEDDGLDKVGAKQLHAATCGGDAVPAPGCRSVAVMQQLDPVAGCCPNNWVTPVQQHQRQEALIDHQGVDRPLSDDQ